MIYEGVVNSRSAELIIQRLKTILMITEEEPYMTSRVEKYRVFRHTAMFLIKRNVGLSFAQIGRLFHKDHATVIHAYRSVKNQLSFAEKLGIDKYRTNALTTEESRAAFDFLISYDDRPYSGLLSDLDSVENQIRELYVMRRRIKNKINETQIYFQ